MNTTLSDDEDDCDFENSGGYFTDHVVFNETTKDVVYHDVETIPEAQD